MNEYAKLVCFYVSLEEAVKHKYFERELVLKTLREALALVDQLMVESSSSGVSHGSWKEKGRSQTSPNKGQSERARGAIIVGRKD
uniref:Uncharacterized protein n=1 Tax=Physcomitrium patens TaxID=3218 RepID=A0A2K1KZU1_PHYPA|nr:hypothetical protein PHYPA_002084 [Physcomitrium patens]